MHNSYLRVKCKFCKHVLEMPYEEVYFQRLEEDIEENAEKKQLSEKS